MDRVTNEEHDRLTLNQLQERKSEQNKQRSVKAEFTRIGNLLESLGQCLKSETIPVQRTLDTVQALTSQSSLVDCGRLQEEVELYGKRSQRLIELENALKDYL